MGKKEKIGKKRRRIIKVSFRDTCERYIKVVEPIADDMEV